MIEFLPEKSGLVLLYTILGLFGGAAAAVANSKTVAPPLWNVIRQGIAGSFAGFVAGALMLDQHPDKVFLTMAASGGSGFLGPYALWEWIAKYRSDAPKPPPPQQS